MAKASRNMSHIMEQLSGNCIFETWTQQWGLKIYPAYQIDKLKFSFIDKGSSGKGKSFDIFVECRKSDAACFDNWAYDILHNRLERVLAAEKQAGEKYPKTYAYTTGENAEKHVGIMNSTRGGYCINAGITVDNEKKYCNIPVSFHSLRYIAEMYQDTYALRKAELLDVWKKAYDEGKKYQKEPEQVQQEPAQATAEPRQEQQVVQEPVQQPAANTAVNEEKKQNTGKDSSTELKPENFHHGNLKALQFCQINDSLFCVRCDSGMDLYLTWSVADKNSDKKLYEKFIQECLKSTNSDTHKLKKPLTFKVMYLENEGKNYFYRFS